MTCSLSLREIAGLMHLMVAGARRLNRRLLQDEISSEKSNRLLAGQVLAELTQLQSPESFRLQVIQLKRCQCA
jgi:hypothetical protein